VEDNHTRYEEALRRGHSYSWDQRWTDAIREFEIAIGESSDEPAAYAGLGMAYFELGELKKSLKNYKQAARYSRGDMIYLRQVADVQERLGMVSEAGQTYMAIGEIQLKRKKLDEAVGNWLRATRLEPNLVGPHQRLAAVYQRQGLLRNAIREYLAIARIFQARGEKDKALKMCQAALKLDPRNADVLTAMELIQHGDQFLEDESEESQAIIEDEKEIVSDAVERMASVLESEKPSWQLRSDDGGVGPLESARQIASEQLAREIFEEDDDEAMVPSGNGLSKLERDALISQALDFQSRDDIEQAIDCYERALDGGVTSPAAHFSLGVLYQDQLRLTDAIREFEFTDLTPDYQIASHFALGELYRARGRMDTAVDHFVNSLKYIDIRTVKLDYTDRVVELYDYLSHSLIVEGEPEKATRFADALVEFLRQKNWEERVAAARERLNRIASDRRTLILGDMLTAGSTQVLESLHLSQEYSERGKFDTAVEEAFRVIQLSPDYLPGHSQLAELMARQDHTEIAVTKFVAIGDTCHMRGDVNGAILNYERALEISPMDLRTRKRLINILIQNNNIDSALDHYMAMGDAYSNLAEGDQARETYLEALELVPKGSADKGWRSRLLRSIADIDMQRLDWKNAIYAYSELNASEPDDEDVTNTLIDLYYKVGQPKLALDHLDAYLMQLVRTGQGSKVVNILERMVDQRPSDVGLVDRLVRLYLQQGKGQEALQLLDQLAEAQLDAGDTRSAIATIDKILELRPPNAASYEHLRQRVSQDLI
jgi:tetratricopeptide (TPR) repeat protein